VANTQNLVPFKKGYIPWNKGLRAKNDKRIRCGKDIPSWTGGKPKCKDCGKQLAGHYNKRCAPCNRKFLSGPGSPYSNKGSKHPNWKGGIRGKDYLERRRFQKTIQKQVFERDDYTCQLCGERGGNLQVDHIQSWADYVKLRFCIDNCRTLCMNCHYEITFGKPMPPTVRAWGHNLCKGGKQP